MNRRQFITSTALGLGAATLPRGLSAAPASLPEATVARLPRWRGFNLQEKFSHTPDEWKTVAPEWGHSNEPFRESDFEWIAGWMRNSLELWKEAGWGWALWCFRGSFGILDSGRADVRYETYKGHQLDRAMLELLRAF